MRGRIALWALAIGSVGACDAAATNDAPSPAPAASPSKPEPTPAGVVPEPSSTPIPEPASTPVPAPEAAPPVSTATSVSDLRSGDIIFHRSQSRQSAAIIAATKSPWSHMGILFVEDGRPPQVFEASKTVRLTPLKSWTDRGKDGHFVVKRLQDADARLNEATLKSMREVAEGLAGKKYDLTFEWSDDRMYCSELVYKIYDRGADIELGKLEKLGDFDLEHPAVRKKLVERYGKDVPVDEQVVSPVAMFDASELVTVFEGSLDDLM